MDCEEKQDGAGEAPRRCGGGCCCGGMDTRTPEERRADEAADVGRVMRFFVWGLIVAGIAILLLKGI